MKIETNCGICRKTSTVEVDPDAFEKWRAGAHIQDVMPELSDADRELLISKTCGPCFDVLFPEDDE